MAFIKGGNNNDNLTGGTADNDEFLAGLGGDYITGSAGNDSINAGYANSASYWRYGFNDFDTVDYRDTYLRYAYGAAAAVHFVVDMILGTAQKFLAVDTLVNTDHLIGVDAVWGGAGNDAFYGRNFWDYEEFGGYGGNDLIDGRGGNDAASYSYAGLSGVNVDLAAGTVTSTDESVGNDTLREVEVVIGSNFADNFDATGYGGISLNRNSFGEGYNIFSPLAGDDTIVGNGETILNYAGVGGAMTVDLSLLTGPDISAQIITAFEDDPGSAAFTPGAILASGVDQIRGGDYDDNLLGGGRANTIGSSTTLSGDASFEGFRGNAGNDFIDGRSGVDRADYAVGNQTEGIVVNLAAGTVVGDWLRTGFDTLRGIEMIASTYMDDVYDASGFTLSNAVGASVNSGDAIVTPTSGEMLASNAFNEFSAYAGNDLVIGNGATRISFSSMLVENIYGAKPAVEIAFASAGSGSGRFGQNDGGLGSIEFSGVYAIRGSVGNDRVTGAPGFQHLAGYYGDDELYGGDGADILFGHLGNNGLPENLSTTFTDDDSLYGGSGSDLLRGDFGGDWLDGGTGNDTMEGGTGNDTFVVDAMGDVVVELAGNAGGYDSVYASVSLVLSDNVEAVYLTDLAALNVTGNALDNTIWGTAGANRLDGKGGNDLLQGWDGDDTLIGGSGHDDIRGGTGTDTVDYSASIAAVAVNLTANTASDGLGGTDALIDIENIVGTGLGDTLTGDAAANILNGAAGIDTMIGSRGNDTYVVDATADVASET